MNSPREWSELQLAADHATVVKSVRNDGLASVVWGVLMTGAGLALFHSVPVAAIGVALIAAGAWQIASPRPAGFLVSGTLLGLIGVLNILGTLMSMLGGDRTPPTFVVLGVLQCGWAGRMFERHRRFASGFRLHVDPAARDRARALLDALRAAKLKDAPDVIEFAIASFPARSGRARLEEQGVLCLIGGGDDVRVLLRSQFDAERTGKTLLGSGAKVRLRIGERQFNGGMSAESWARLERWKQGSAATNFPIAA